MPSQSSERLFIHNASQLILPQLVNGPSGRRLTLQTIAGGAVLTENGRIALAGTTLALEKDPRVKSALTFDASRGVVTPGFVDSHTHLVFAAARQDEYERRIQGARYESIAAAGGGIRNSVRRLRELSEDELFARARHWCVEFLRHGTTTIEAKSGYGLDTQNELKILRVLARLQRDESIPLEIVPTFLGAHEIPDEYRNRRETYIDLICEEMIPRVAREKLAVFCDVFCERNVFTIDEARRILTIAARHALKLKIHADQLTRNGGARLAVELGAVSADHLEHVDNDDVRLLAGSRTVATLLPGASFHLGMKQLPPARQLLDSGAIVALATDFNPGTSPTINMQTILSIACSSLRMTPAESFAAATLGGAHALDGANRWGSIEAGKPADLVVFDAEDYRLVPYHYGMNLVRAVIKAGCLLFDTHEKGRQQGLFVGN